MRIATLLVLCVVVLCPATADADSDGYYCTGPGFLAYQQRFVATPFRHELRIVQFDATRGIVARPVVVLEDFQPQAMLCSPGRVEIIAADFGVVVDFDAQGAPRATRTTAPTKVDRNVSLNNLGHWATPGVVDLDAIGTSRFQLVIARASQRFPGGNERHTVTRLVQRRPTSTGNIVSSFLVFDGVLKETAD